MTNRTFSVPSVDTLLPVWNDATCSAGELRAALTFWRAHHNQASRNRVRAAIRYFRESHPFQCVEFADNPPADPLRKAARGFDFATHLTPSQVNWARSHDWFVSANAAGAIVVCDRFTYNGAAFEEQLIWGGSFAELRLWAGY